MKYCAIFYLVWSIFLQLQAQEHFNRIIDFGYQRNSIYAVHTEADKITIHGRVLPSDTVNIREIFYAELMHNGDILNFITLNRGSSMTNNLINDIVFQDGKYINSFHENKRAFLVQICDNTYEVVDSFINTLDPERPIQITEYFIDENQELWYSGVDSRIISNPPLVRETRVFITKWSDPSQHFEMKNPISKATGGNLVPMSQGYLFYTRAQNPGFPTPEGWGPESYFFKVSENGDIMDEIKTDPSDQLDAASDIFRNEDDTFIMCGLEAKKDPNGSGKVIRPIVYKFSFENGIEWKVNPYGPEWTSSYERLKQIIPSTDGEGYIVLGEDYITDSLGTYIAATLSKIAHDGSLVWVKYYNSGYNGIHRTYDVQTYLDGYIFVGDVFNLVDFPEDNTSFYGWMVYVNKDGDFDKLSSNIGIPLDVNLKFNLYPNPTADILYIKEDLDQGYSYDKLEIIDIIGQSMIKLPNKGKRIDISVLQAGQYFINFYEKGKIVGTEKFTKT
jgi:hypothetical protein